MTAPESPPPAEQVERPRPGPGESFAQLDERLQFVPLVGREPAGGVAVHERLVPGIGFVGEAQICERLDQIERGLNNGGHRGSSLYPV
jgi:hypothetical protein